jgi:recombination protein RecA
VQVAAIPTGAINLDAAIGIGGIPRGRITEIYGPESSGKTTLCLHVIANAQKAGGVAAFIDAEHALDIEYARKLGVDVDNLLVSQPDTGEQALEIAEVLVRSNAVDVVVIDSVAALVPRAEIEGEMGDSHVGLQARLMSQALRKLTGAINRSHTRHLHQPDPREDRRDVRQPRDHHRRPGAQVLRLLRLDIRRIGSIKDKGTCWSATRRGEGGEEQGGAALQAGGVRHHVPYGDVRLGQGRENAKAFLQENADIAAEVEAKVRDVRATAEDGGDDVRRAGPPSPAAGGGPRPFRGSCAGGWRYQGDGRRGRCDPGGG